MTKIKLFCFPYAGGAANVYRKLQDCLNNQIELFTFEYAGRGRRISEKMNDNFQEVIDESLEYVKNNMGGSPYALFGHSMGALLCYELYHKIKENGLRRPFHVFLSGRNSPNNPYLDKIYHKMNMEQFKNELFQLGGFPSALMKSEEFLNLMIPIIKNDFKIIETFYSYEKSKKMDCGISVFYSNDDGFDTGNITDWASFTNKKASFFSFNGGHFFVNQYFEEIAEKINQTLLKN